MDWLLKIVGAFIILIALSSIITGWLNRRRRRARKKYLMQKYGDENTVNLIMNRQLWQGQTGDQLIDSIGLPRDVDSSVLKSKTKETWKYHMIRKNQYRLKIKLENDIVVGWDKK